MGEIRRTKGHTTLVSLGFPHRPLLAHFASSISCRLKREIVTNIKYIPEEKWIDYEHLKDNISMGRTEFLFEVDKEQRKMNDFITQSTIMYTPACALSCGHNRPRCVLETPRNLSKETLQALNNYIKLNQTGFRKICKKFDKNSSANPISEVVMRSVGHMLELPRSELSLITDAYMNVGVLHDQTEDDSLLWLSFGSDENGAPYLPFWGRATVLLLLLAGTVLTLNLILGF